MNSADHQEDALESALDQPIRKSVGTEQLPPSNRVTTENGEEECRYLATDIIKVIGLRNQVGLTSISLPGNTSTVPRREA